MTTKEATELALEGQTDILITYANLLQQKKDLEAQIEKIKDSAINYAKQYGTDQFEYKGFKINYQKGRAMFSFKGIEKWNEAQKDLKEIEEEAKMAYQAYVRGQNLVNTDTGETPMLPDVTYGQDYLVIKPV